MKVSIATGIAALCAIVSGGLLSGLYFSFDVSIRRSFATLPDGEYVRLFADINQAILNPRFLMVFAAAPIASVALAVLAPTRWTILAAAASLTALGITMFGNVPLNNALENAYRSDVAVATIRANFESRWNALNVARCLAQTAAVAATVLFALGTRDEG